MIADETIDELKERAQARAEEILTALLPGGRRKAGRFVAGGVDGSRGESLDYILQGQNEGYWRDWASGQSGDIIHLWMAARGVGFPDAVKQLADFLGVDVDTTPRTPRKLNRDYDGYSDPEPKARPALRPEPTDGFRPRKRPRGDDEAAPAALIDAAQASFRALDDQTIQAEAKNLGLDPAVLQSFGEGPSGLGWHGGRLAYRYPQGLKVRNSGEGGTPRFIWVSGRATAPWRTELISSSTRTVVVTEGETDAMAAVAAGIELDGETVVVASPGTGFVKEWAPLFQGKDVVLAFDADEAGQAASAKVSDLLRPVVSTLRTVDWNGRKEGVKDLRDLLKASGPSAVKDLLNSASDEFLRSFKTAGDLRRLEFGDDPSSMIGFKRRWLGRGGSFVIIGPSGIGKSTLVLLMAVCWAAGVPFFGITPRRPLRILIVQAENDDGDLREMLDGAIEALGTDLTASQLALVERNLIFRCETEKTGLAFCQWLEPAITKNRADMVLADPLLSYIGDDVSAQKVCSEFLRTWLQPILHRSGAMIGFVHHTGKTSSDPKARSGWTESDGAYLGIGSSEITNWARAIATLVPASKDSQTFKFSLVKRGGRAGMTSRFTDGSVKSIYLAHAETGLGWREVEEPEREAPKQGRKATLSERDVIHALGSPSLMTPKDRLVADLVSAFPIKERTVRNLVASMIQKGLVEVARKESRAGGGPKLEYLRQVPQ